MENTPWHDRHAYVVGPPGSHRFAKELHVSPFLPMGLDYELLLHRPWGTAQPRSRRASRVTGASSPPPCPCGADRWTAPTLGRLLWRHPAMTHRVTAGIYAQAVRLRLKGAPFFANPAGRGRKPASADAHLARTRWTPTEIRAESAPSGLTVCNGWSACRCLHR